MTKATFYLFLQHWLLSLQWSTCGSPTRKETSRSGCGSEVSLGSPSIGAPTLWVEQSQWEKMVMMLCLAVTNPLEEDDKNVAQASLGTGSLPPGWEKGLTGSCVGERRSQSIFMMRLSKEFYNVKPRKYNLILVSCFRMLLLSPSMAFGEVGIFHKIPSNVSNQGQEDNHPKYQIIRSKDIEFWICRRHLSWQLRFWRSSDRPVHQSSQGKAKIQIQSKIQWQT